MKKYLLLIAVVAVLAGCSKHEVVDNPGLEGAATKAYSMTVDLMAGQNINVGTVSFYDPTDGNGGPLEVTYTLTGGWTMTESHVYAGPTGDMPVNQPGAPKIGKFPYQETHANVTTYTYSIPLGEVDMGNFAIAAHCVVNNNGTETGWASGDKTFNDKGWGTYISNFYAPSNFVPNDLYAIQKTTDGTFNLVLIDANNGSEDLIYSENITGSNGTISGAAYDPLTSHVFFTMGNGLYANNLNNDNPTYLIASLSTSDIGGTTFNGDSYFYYNNTLHTIVQVQMSYDDASSVWSSNGENIVSPTMDISTFEVTDITSYNNTIFLIGPNSDNPETEPYDLLEYHIDNSTFEYTSVVKPLLSAAVGSPTIAATDNPNYDPVDPESSPFLLYSKNIDGGIEKLVGIDSVDGTLDDSPGNSDDSEDPVILGR